MPSYMIVGLYDSGQRYCDLVEAPDAAGAEAQAPDGLELAAIITGPGIENCYAVDVDEFGTGGEISADDEEIVSRGSVD